MLFALLEILFWVYAVASWCMCFYVLFSCGEGIWWFTTLHNYLLIFGATCGASIAPFRTVPSSSLLIVFTGWSFYAMLVTTHSLRFRLWRSHVLPVTAPLVFLMGWAQCRQSALSTL
ncbi:hypothetical protein ABL78_2376 [Leptomonas seymouri]|uniref:Transmembrane protein n=1 Tax=Leptomonas seymouri TaxID=5684 RepID=A0A0N1PFE4_LEPSE|nr:hypothetical protein ABL78_2376 [Leptomonas seymouri]|eukprot:KPI88564.1 hypothetical protein ABL78_2376 [Leptomonas seymouri]